MQVQFTGFKFGNAVKPLANGEYVGPTLRQFGVDTRGISVLVNGTTIAEGDLDKYPLRDGDEVKAAVKAIGGTDVPEGTTEPDNTAGSDPAGERA